MSFYVYLIIAKYKHNFISYVGYTSNLKKTYQHNSSKGAKFTRGRVEINLSKKIFN